MTIDEKWDDIVGRHNELAKKEEEIARQLEELFSEEIECPNCKSKNMSYLMDDFGSLKYHGFMAKHIESGRLVLTSSVPGGEGKSMVCNNCGFFVE